MFSHALSSPLARSSTDNPSSDIASSERFFERVNSLKHVTISDMRLQEIREAIAADPILCDLAAIIRRGWPEKRELPTQLSPYYDVRDTLSIGRKLTSAVDHP